MNKRSNSASFLHACPREGGEQESIDSMPWTPAYAGVTISSYE
jgi:hypothetical protein